MAEEARKQRLKDLRDRARGKEAPSKENSQTLNITDKKVNETPDEAPAPDVEKSDQKEEQEAEKKMEESLIKQELRKIKENMDESTINIAPRKPDWDLKRDASKKLDKLNRRTQRAIVEILKEKMAQEEAEESSDSSNVGSDSE